MLSIENAAIERLHARIQQSPLAEVREQLVQHLEETREQKSRLITLINRLGGEPTNERSDLFGYSLPKVLADAFKASATTPEEQELRTIEADALIEHAEVIGYNMAIQMATKINSGEAIMPLRQNLQEEEKMVAWIELIYLLTLYSYGQKLMMNRGRNNNNTTIGAIIGSKEGNRSHGGKNIYKYI